MIFLPLFIVIFSVVMLMFCWCWCIGFLAPTYVCDTRDTIQAGHIRNKGPDIRIFWSLWKDVRPFMVLLVFY